MFDRIRSTLRSLRGGGRTDAVCILPWVHIHARVDGKMLPCCIADETPKWGSLHEQTARALFNSKLMRQLRLDMLAGVRSSVCRHCYNLEDAGGTSLRTIFNTHLGAHAEVVKETSSDGSVNPDRIVSLDIRFSNICNLRCRSCGSAASTSWYQDDPATAPPDFRILRAGRTPEDLWEQIEPFLPTVEVMHFAGGEPLLMDETYQTIEKLLELGRTDVELTYNTNVSTWTHKNWNALELWKHFDKVKVMASLDGVGERGEYIRKGLDWAKAVENCKQLLQECPQINFQLNATVGLLNALHLPDFLDACVEAGIAEPDQFHLNFIQDPVHQSMTSLPAEYKRQVREVYEPYIERLGRKSAAAHRFEQALSYMDSKDTSSELGELRRYMAELDEKRGESFSETFPELAGLMAAE